MRLGDLEQRILLACLARRQPRRDPPAPDVWRAELPGLLWGWKVSYRFWHPSRLHYLDVPAGDYPVRQASLSRALTSLYDKGLIRFSYAHHGWYAPEGAPRGRPGKSKSLRLTPLGMEVAFLRLIWKPRWVGVPNVTPVYQVTFGSTSTKIRRKYRHHPRAWVQVTLEDAPDA